MILSFRWFYTNENITLSVTFRFWLESLPHPPRFYTLGLYLQADLRARLQWSCSRGTWTLCETVLLLTLHPLPTPERAAKPQISAFAFFFAVCMCLPMSCVAAPHRWPWKSVWMSVWRPWISSLTTTSPRAWRGCGQGNRAILSPRGGEFHPAVTVPVSVCSTLCTFVLELFIAVCF